MADCKTCDFCRKVIEGLSATTIYHIPPDWIAEEYHKRHPNDADESMCRTVVAAAQIQRFDICKECWDKGER